jgi:DNA-binding transcriptional LysR family regulator
MLAAMQGRSRLREADTETRRSTMTVHQLKIFLAVSKHSSITLASQELRISEPSVYQQVKSLQASFGRQLYRRVGRGIKLTSDGKALCTEAVEIVERLEAMEKKFGGMPAHGAAASLVIGGSHVFSNSLLTTLVATYKQGRPDVHIGLRTKSSGVIEQLVLNAEVDIGLITNPSYSADLILEPFRQETMVVVVAPDHPLARKKQLTLAELAQGPLIIRERKKSASRRILQQMAQLGLRPNIFMTCDSAQTVKAAVMRGLGLGILYQDHARHEIRAGHMKLVTIQGLKKVNVQSFIVYKKIGAPLGDAARDFLELLRRSQMHGRMSHRVAPPVNTPPVHLSAG